MKEDPPTLDRARHPAHALAVLAAFAIFVAHAAWLGRWVVDDAGISYAYARSLAQGHGLVAQPGEIPVEGVTNLLWVALLAVPMAFGAFDPALTPKLLAAALTLISFGALAAVLARAAQPATLVLGALGATAATTAFVVWSVSGLENALAATLVALLLLIATRLIEPGRSSPAEPAAAGGVLFLLFATRPEGILYLPLIPLLIGAAAKRPAGSVVAYAVAFLIPWVLLTAFRVAYFHDVLPNTYYAKGGAGWRQTLWLLERLPVAWAGALYAVAMLTGATAAIAAAAGIGGSLRRRLGAGPNTRLTLWLFFAWTLVVYAAMPGDWMPHFRFGTPAFLLGPAAILTAISAALPRLAAPARVVGTASIAVAPLVAGAHGLWNSRAFVAEPTVPFEDVRDLARRIDRAAQTAGAARASVLLPDIGGALWEDRFRVVDLAGLCDPAIARAMKLDKDAFYRYVIVDRRPELIWVHSFWSRTAALPRDPRFAASYATAWAEGHVVDSIPNLALYVRRDLPRVTPESVGVAFRR